MDRRFSLLNPSLITTVLVVLILLSFLIGAYRVQQQARRIDDIILAQETLRFQFPTSDGGTAYITCTQANDHYACTTELRVAPTQRPQKAITQ